MCWGVAFHLEKFLLACSNKEQCSLHTVFYDITSQRHSGFSQSLGLLLGLPWWLSGKESACNVADLGSIPGLGRAPGEGKGYPLQYSVLENSSCRVLQDWRLSLSMINIFSVFKWLVVSNTEPSNSHHPSFTRPLKKHHSCQARVDYSRQSIRGLFLGKLKVS